MKRIVALVIVSILLIPSAVSVFAAEEYEHISVTCASSITEEVSTVDFAKKGDQLYISDSDLATFSGFTLSQTSGSGAEFSRSGETVTVSGGVEIDNRLWFPVEESCEKLYVKVTQYGRALIFTGRERTYKELIALTDSIMTGYGYEIIDTHNFAGRLALTGSWFYRFASGDYGKALTLSYKQETFDKIIQKVLQQKTDLSGFLGKCKKANKYAKTLIEIAEIEEDRTIDNLITVLGKGITEYEVKDITEIADVFLDPLGTLAKEDIGVDLKGMDVVSLVNLHYYIDAVIGCSDTAFNMIDRSYYSNKTGDLFPALDDRIKSAAKKVHNYHDTTDALNAYKLYFSELGKNIAINTTTHAIDLYIESGIKAITSDAGLIKLAQTAFKMGYNQWFDADAKIEFAEINRMTNDLQIELQKIYMKARNDPALAINAKYIALLYAKYYDIWWYALNWDITESESISAYSPIAKLYACSDSEILDEVKNDKIDIEAITNPKQVEDKPAAIDPKLIGKWVDENGLPLSIEDGVIGTDSSLGKFVCDYTVSGDKIILADDTGRYVETLTYILDGDRLTIYRTSDDGRVIDFIFTRSEDFDIVGTWYNATYAENANNPIDSDFNSRITFNNDRTFVFRHNLYEGFGNTKGTYEVSGDRVYCRVTSRDFSGFADDKLTEHVFRIENGRLIYEGGDVGATYAGDRFERREMSVTTPPGGGGGGGSVEGDWVVVDSDGRFVEGLLVTFHNGKETINAGGNSVSYSYRINGDLLIVTHENSDSIYRFEVSGDRMNFYSPDDGEHWVSFKRK